LTNEVEHITAPKPVRCKIR